MRRRIHPGEPDRLRHQRHVVRAEVLQVVQVERLENAQRLENLHRAAGRRGRSELVAPVHGPQGRFPLERLGIAAQVVVGDQPAVLGQVGRDRPPQGAVIEGHPAVPGERPEGGRQAGLAERLAGFIGPAIVEVGPRGVWVRPQPIDRLGRALEVEPRDRSPPVGELNRRLEHLRDRQAAELPVQARPSRDDPGHHRRHRADILGLLREHLRARVVRGTPHEVQRAGLTARQRDHGDADPAEPGEVGFHDRDGRGGRDHRVDGIASGGQHPKPGLRRERIGRCDHPPAPQRGRADAELRCSSRVCHNPPPHKRPQGRA